MQLYPNPTDGMLNITIPAIVNEDITFIMYNALGEIVFKAQHSDLNIVNGSSGQNTYSMDIGYLANGIYVMQLLTDHDAHMEQIVISK